VLVKKETPKRNAPPWGSEAGSEAKKEEKLLPRYPGRLPQRASHPLEIEKCL
jgi:hypothetical protein